MTTETEKRSLFPGSAPAAEKTCPYCRTVIHGNAKKCAACAEWLVETSLDWPSQALKVIGFASMTLSLLGAIIVWFVGNRLATVNAPFGFDPSGGTTNAVALWAFRGWSIFLAMQGCVIGTAIVAFAERGPRRPR